MCLLTIHVIAEDPYVCPLSPSFTTAHTMSFKSYTRMLLLAHANPAHYSLGGNAGLKTLGFWVEDSGLKTLGQYHD
jgi:hypothetical protein